MKRGTILTAVLGIAATGMLAHDPVSTRVTWDREIEPLVRARCAGCHTPGGPAPMSLATYEDTRPWARAIREEVLTRRMPVWHVVRGYGDFTNDPSLSPFEIGLFAAWADGGAPKTLPPKPGGAKAAPLPAVPPLPAGAPASNPPATRDVEIPCRAATLPAGRVLGIRPMLARGADLRAIITHGDGRAEPLIWLRNYTPDGPETYWLRRPFDVTPATRLDARGPEPCRITVRLAAETAR